MRGSAWGYVIMAASLAFGAAYFASLVLWLKYEIMGHDSAYWWTWWIIAVPVAVIVAFAVFFATWVGWVMVKSRPKTVYQLMKEAESRGRDFIPSRTG